MRCGICEIGCDIPEGGIGRCSMYTNESETVTERYPDRYITVMPISIETMPMVHYYPQETFLQVSGIGCNFSCGGCISETIARHAGAVAGALKHVPSDALIRRAHEQGCRGIAFCLNDPIVAHQTLGRIARAAHREGLLVGCATNGYYTEKALEELASYIDFVNVGLKGASEGRYRACGAFSAEPAFRTIRTLAESGVHVETSCIYTRGGEDEIRAAAARVAGISAEIPFQVMRFIPFGDAASDLEPTIAESERICEELRRTLRYTYLFNSPGTDYLTTRCPACGAAVIRREFFGPMGARPVSVPIDLRCSCGYRLPVAGGVGKTPYSEPGMMGGYRFTRALEMVHAILVCLGVESDDHLAGIWSGIVRDDYITGLHGKIQRVDTYLSLVRELGERANRSGEAEALTAYLGGRVAAITAAVEGRPRPRVYYSMGTPLFALNAERFETHLVELAGGDSVNRRIERVGKPGVNITREEFTELDPEYIFISGFLSAPVSDYRAMCGSLELCAAALDREQIYTLPPGWDFGNPRWILGLMYIANTLHPDVCAFDLAAEQAEFYRTFYRTDPVRSCGSNRSFYRP